MMDSNLTALVTGATSGLGFEAAAQLAEAGYARVTITGRSLSRAKDAKDALVERTGRDVFDVLAVDFNLPESVRSASAEFSARAGFVDFLLLNAGVVPGKDHIITDAGVDITFASSLIGHHQLTMALLKDGLLSDSAHIVIAGSEAARGDVPMMKLAELGSLAESDFDGDLDKAAEALIRGTAPLKYKAMDNYANAKVFVALWSAALARRLPEGMTVNAVSPGATPGTDAARNSGFFMRRIMMPMMQHAPSRMGLAADVPVAAKRYIDASELPTDTSGKFFASKPKKMTGPIQVMENSHFTDEASQEAAWDAVVRVSETPYPA